MKSIRELAGKGDAKQWSWIAAVALAGAATLLLIYLALNGNAVGDWITRLIAVGSVVVALLSRRQSKRSADAAERNATLAHDEEIRRRHKWALEPHPVPYRHVLRNVGTVTATHVQILNHNSDFARADFTQADDPVTIGPGQSRAIDLMTKWSTVGTQVTIKWIPEGESEERTWTEVIQPSASEAADRGKDQKDKDARQNREEDIDREHRRELRSLLLQLGDAYSVYRADPAGPGNRLRVQLLTAALPPSIAREIGHEVDVARDVWGPSEYPFDQHLHPDDAHLIQDVMPELELIWNMRMVQGDPVYGPTDAPGLNQEPRIWWAVQGYVERVKERQSGTRHTRRSRRDQESHDKAMADIRRFEATNAKDGASTTAPGSQSDGMACEA